MAAVARARSESLDIAETPSSAQSAERAHRTSSPIGYTVAMSAAPASLVMRLTLSARFARTARDTYSSQLYAERVGGAEFGSGKEGDGRHDPNPKFPNRTPPLSDARRSRAKRLPSGLYSLSLLFNDLYI
jgi:hypothetical protein